MTLKNPKASYKEQSEAILDIMDTGKETLPVDNQKAKVKEKLQKQMDEGKRILLVSTDVYSALPTAVVTLEKLYPDLAKGYVYNKRTGIKIPYCINYYSLIANNNALKLYRTYSPESIFE